MQKLREKNKVNLQYEPMNVMGKYQFIRPARGVTEQDQAQAQGHMQGRNGTGG